MKRVTRTIKSIMESLVLSTLLTSVAVGLLMLCGVCRINWSVFAW